MIKKIVASLILGFSCLANCAFADSSEIEVIKKLEAKIQVLQLEVQRLSDAKKTDGWACAARCGRIYEGRLWSMPIMSSAPTLAEAWAQLQTRCFERNTEYRSHRVFKTVEFVKGVPMLVWANLNDSCVYDPGAYAVAADPRGKELVPASVEDTMREPGLNRDGAQVLN